MFVERKRIWIKARTGEWVLSLLQPLFTETCNSIYLCLQSLIINKHHCLGPPHAAPISTSHWWQGPKPWFIQVDSLAVPGKQSIPKTFVSAWPHESGKLWTHALPPVLLACSKLGTSLWPWEEGTWAKKHWGASVLSVHSTVLKSPVPASRAWQQPEPTVWSMKPQRLKQKETKQPVTSFQNIQCSNWTALLRNPFIILLFQYLLLTRYCKVKKTEPDAGPTFSSVQSLRHVQLFATPWTAVCQASLSITNSRSLPKLMSIESVIPSNHLTLCCPLFLLPTIFPSIGVFSNESALHIRWPKYWSFSFNISPSNEHSGLISFRMDWLDLLAIQGTLKSLLQCHNSKASILQHSAFFIVQLSHPYMTTGKNHSLD